MSDVYVIISEWFSGFVCNLEFILEWKRFNFRVQCFEICTRVCLKEVAHIRGLDKLKYNIYSNILLVMVFSWFSELMQCVGSLLVLWLQWYNYFGCLRISWLIWVSISSMIGWFIWFTEWVIFCSNHFYFWYLVLGLNDGSGFNLKIDEKWPTSCDVL